MSELLRKESDNDYSSSGNRHRGWWASRPSPKLLPQTRRPRTRRPGAGASRRKCVAQSALGFVHTGYTHFQVRMPGAEYQGNDPYGFMSLAEVIKYFDDYVLRFDPPVHCSVEVHSVEKTREGYLVRTSEGIYEAENVVIATGLYQAPKIPKLSEHLPEEILQIHSMEYKNASSLPAGAVLVVGTGQSGAQIAEELYQSGRKVYLSVGSAR